MLIEELDIAVVDSLCDFLSDLVRAAALNHVQAGPAALGLCAGGGTDKQVVLQLSLEAVLLDVVCESSGNHPGFEVNVLRSTSNDLCYILGVPNTGETGPADVRAIGEVVNEILSFGELLEVGWAPHTAFQ